MFFTLKILDIKYRLEGEQFLGYIGYIEVNFHYYNKNIMYIKKSIMIT